MQDNKYEIEYTKGDIYTEENANDDLKSQLIQQKKITKRNKIK